MRNVRRYGDQTALSCPPGGLKYSYRELNAEVNRLACALQDKGGENALTMDLQGGNVELKAKTKLTLSAGTGASMVLEASGNVTEKANVKVAVQAATIEEKASAQMTIQGGMVSIN